MLPVFTLIMSTIVITDIVMIHHHNHHHNHNHHEAIRLGVPKMGTLPSTNWQDEMGPGDPKKPGEMVMSFQTKAGSVQML